MKDFIGRIQQDLNKLQKTLEKEGDDLLKKIKTAAKKAADNPGVTQRKREIEKLIEAKMKQFEPALEKFYNEVKSSAGKYGIDLNGIEKKVKQTANAAKTKLSKKRTTTKKSATSKAPARKKAATKKKTSSN